MVGDFVIHGGILRSYYTQFQGVFRSPEESQKYLPIMVLAHLVMAFAFSMIFSETAPDRPWLQRGLRFGIAVALLMAVPTYAIYFVVQPISGTLASLQILLGSLLVIILGVVAGFIIRSDTASERV